MFSSMRTVPVPPFPTLPKHEYEKRYMRIKTAMDEAGIDLLLITQQENVEYLSGYISSHWFMHGIIPGVVLLPLHEEPCLLVPHFWLGTAQKKSWIEEIITHRNSHSNPDTFSHLVVDFIKKRGWHKDVIGYEAGQEMRVGMPIQQFDAIRQGLGNASWVEAGHTIWQARIHKSPIEVNLLAVAAAGTCRALERVARESHAGIAEIEIGQMVRKYQIEEGCEDRQFLNIRCGPSRYSMTDTLPEERRIETGEVLILDVGMHRKGYWSDTARCAVIGKPSNLYLEVYDMIVQAQKAALGEICNGAPASAPYHAARKVLDKAGYGVHIDMMGHGIGMSMYEPPMLSPVAEGELSTGMVLCVEPWITLPNDGGVFCFEETVVVTDEHYEKLTTWNSQDLWIIT